MDDFSYWDILRSLLLAGRWTVALSLVAFSGGALLGLLVMLVRTTRNPASRVAAGYVKLVQGTPLLMQLFLAFFGIALAGIDVPAWAAAGVALVIWSSAFLAEIWRGCVEAVPRGQWESSASLAMTYMEQMRYVILPQAVRIAIPPTVGFLVQVIKGTALTSIIGFIELSKAATALNNATLQPLQVYGTVAVLYFLLCWPLSMYSRKLESKLHVAHSH